MESWEYMNRIVKKCRNENGQMQKFLADKCGYDEKTFSLLINGRKPILDVDIKKFFHGMGVTPNDLFDPPPSQQRKPS